MKLQSHFHNFKKIKNPGVIKICVCPGIGIRIIAKPTSSKLVSIKIVDAHTYQKTKQGKPDSVLLRNYIFFK